MAGRFTSRDTIGIWGDPQGVGNGLAYVGNNPWKWFDPLGLEPADTPTTQWVLPVYGSERVLPGHLTILDDAGHAIASFPYGTGGTTFEDAELAANSHLRQAALRHGAEHGELALQVGLAINPVAEVIEVGSGKSLITGEDLTVSDYAWSAAGMLSGPLDDLHDVGKIAKANDLRRAEKASETAGACMRATGKATKGALEKHHAVPKEVLKMLPDDVANNPAVRGKKGAPNRWPVPKDTHAGLHKGAGGGAYNEAFKRELQALGREPTVDDVVAIRNKLASDFGIAGYGP